MVRFRNGLMALVVMMTLVSMPVFAGSEEDLRQYVDRNTQQLVEKLNTEKGLYNRDPEAFYRRMDEELSDFVDFRRIAARVMGRYARQTTPEQRDEFVRRFKRSMFDSYAQALVNTEDLGVEVKEVFINPDNENRASVHIVVISASGNRYPVTYSMYRKDDGLWKMENVIVEGVNIGLAFRDRFSQEMEKRRGEVQAVIDNWGSATDALKFEHESDNS